MTTPDDRSAVPSKKPPIERNRLEVIRFTSSEECKNAIQALIDLGEHHQITSHEDPNEWWVWTRTVRALRGAGVPFRWMTENI
jgi:hypothetical protein